MHSSTPSTKTRTHPRKRFSIAKSRFFSVLTSVPQIISVEINCKTSFFGNSPLKCSIGFVIPSIIFSDDVRPSHFAKTTLRSPQTPFFTTISKQLRNTSLIILPLSSA
jgi:hypothetical protein